MSANWHGRFRPYLFRDGAYRPLIPASIEPDLERVDLYSPTPVASGHIVMGGQTAGKRPFDLYVYDLETRSLRNVTSSPDVDDGDFCVERATGLVSFRSGGDTQRFVRISPDGVSNAFDAVSPGFDRCIWTSQDRLIGVEGRYPPYRVSICAVRPPQVACTPSEALSNVEDVVDLFVTGDQRAGVVARKRGMPFRRPYLLSDGTLVDVTDRTFPPGDVLEYDGTHARLGLHGRYWTTAEATPNDAVTVLETKRIGERHFAIAADFTTSATLAELHDGAWRLVAPPEWTPPQQTDGPMEVWLRSRRGQLYQAMYFGPLAPTRVVLWIHGGFAENVSRSFDPYFHWLNQRGFGVLALNYPGSSGRGARYESQLGPRGNVDALQAAFDYLWSQHVETVVSWSISTGYALQSEILAHRFGVSAMIDHAGGDATERRAEAKRQRIPYLSIAGEHDEGGGDASADVRYPGGREITFEPDFRMVSERVDRFLRDVPLWRYRSPPPTEGALVLDPAHAGNARDPNRHRGLSESELTFQLAHALMGSCLRGRPVVMTRTGHPTLEKSPDASVHDRATLLEIDPHAALLSLHFNASSSEAPSDNLTSAFVPIKADATETRLAAGLVAAMQGIGVAPKLSYPELEGLSLRMLQPGVFERYLFLLRPSGHVRLHATPVPPRVMFEVAYYDDEAENRRLQERSLSEDGTWVRPRIEEIANAICPAVSRFFDQ